jgi:hypothetical protein
MKRIYNYLLPPGLPGAGYQAQQLVANYTFDGKASDATAFANNAQVHGATLTQDVSV